MWFILYAWSSRTPCFDHSSGIQPFQRDKTYKCSTVNNYFLQRYARFQNRNFVSISWLNGHSFQHRKNPGLKNYNNQNSGVTRNLQSKASKESELRRHKIVIKSVITIYENEHKFRKHQEKQD